MSKQKSLTDIQAGWEDYDRPKDGQIFEHYKGGRYEIVATGFIEKTKAPCVVYRSLENDVIWVRTAKDFFETIESGGVEGPRFVLVN